MKCGCGTETDKHSSWCPRDDLKISQHELNYITLEDPPTHRDLNKEELVDWYASRGYTDIAEMIRRMNEQTEGTD